MSIFYKLFCALRGHAGLSPTQHQHVWRCKKCGSNVNVNPWRTP